MFGADRSAKGDVVVFSLSGRITAEEVSDLRGLVAAEGVDRHLVLDLQEVKLVDRDVVTNLAECEAHGISLVHCPAYICEWIVRGHEAE